MEEKFDNLASLFQSTFQKLQEESSIVSQLQGELHNRQPANDFFNNLKNTKKRLFERQAHHYKHYVLNKNKSDLFTTFLSAKETGNRVFIPRKYRLKLGNVKNKEVASIKFKESMQKMENDINCMKEYSDSHQTQVLAIEEELNKSVRDNIVIPSEIKAQILTLIQDHFNINKQKAVEEWSKKEKFFLTLQTEYFEKLTTKEPSQPNEDADEELVELLMALGDEPEPATEPAIDPPKSKNVKTKSTKQPKPDSKNKKNKQSTKKVALLQQIDKKFTINRNQYAKKFLDSKKWNQQTGNVTMWRFRGGLMNILPGMKITQPSPSGSTHHPSRDRIDSMNAICQRIAITLISFVQHAKSMTITELQSTGVQQKIISLF